MFYTVYKITNKINGKIYIGAHKTDNLDDSYMGSGNLIKAAQKKYGIKNFEKEILAVFDSADQMFNEEMNLISELDPDYNMHPGGKGGFSLTEEQEKKRIESIKNCPKDVFVVSGKKNIILLHSYLENNEDFYTQLKINLAKNISKVRFKGPHTEETKSKIGKTNSLKQKGEKNSMFGTCWVMNDEKSIQISKNDLDKYLSMGYIKGRKIRKDSKRK